MTSEDLYEIHRSLGRIEGKMNTFIDQMAVMDDRSNALDARTRRVENRQHWYAGMGALLGAILGAFGIHFRWPV